VLSIEEEAIVVAFRKHTLLPLDDCLYALQATIPHLTRSSLHRCYQRHGISRLPEVEGDKPAKQAFKKYPIGYFHIDIAEVRTEEGKLYLFVAIDRTSKFAFAELHEKATRETAANFLKTLMAAVPYKINTVLTDNGTHFTTPGNACSQAQEIKECLARGEVFRAHAFEYACAKSDIDHRLTKPKHPWTNGQVERMNRTLKEATVRRYHYDSHDQLRDHLVTFLAAYNFAKRLKTLRGLTPHEYISNTSLPPITFPGIPEWRGRNEALEAELQPAQTALEPGDQAARNVLALRRRGFFSAGLMFSIASHIPAETAQYSARLNTRTSRSRRSVRSI
jgi:transposase-like protein